jgi:uncharacterized protein YndB with AHSA1/START domain
MRTEVDRVSRVTSTVTIERPVGDVYRHFLELDKHPSDPDVDSVTKEPEGPTGPGTVFRFRSHKARGKVRETSMRFIALEPNRRIEFDGDVGPVRPRGSFILEEVATGTRLTVRIEELNPVGPLKLVAPVLAQVGQKIWDGRLKNIKTLVEASAP